MMVVGIDGWASARQHCVLWLDGARTAWRTKSCIWGASAPDVDAVGFLIARAALCSASPNEQASNAGVAVAQAAARSNSRLEVIGNTLMSCSGMDR